MISPLSECFPAFLRLHGVEIEAEAGLGDLEIDGSEDNPALSLAPMLDRARRAGLDLMVVRVPLDTLRKVAEEARPLLFLNSGMAAIAEGKAISKSLDRRYLGYALVPRARAAGLGSASASVLAGSERKGHWFWGAMVDLWKELPYLIPASIFIHLGALAMPVFVMTVYDRVVPNFATHTLWVLAAGVAMVFVFDFVMRIARGLFIELAAKSIDRSLSARLFGHALRLDFAARPSSAGAFAGHLRGYETIREFLTSATVSALVDVPFSLLMIGLVFWLAGPVGWIPVGFSVLAILVTLAIQPFLRRVAAQSYAESIDRHALLAESANALESIKAANSEEFLQRRMADMVAASGEADLRVRRWSHFGSSFTTFCINLSSVGVIVASVYQIQNHAMSMGAMIACVMVVGRAMAPLGGVSALLLRLQQSLASFRGLSRIMSLPEENDSQAVRREMGSPSYRLDGVSFGYPGTQVPALANLNLSIDAGERIAILGRAGSGKSTLLRVLSRLYVASEGAVLIDGLDSSQMSASQIRTLCGYLPQDGMLMNGTLQENVMMGGSYRSQEGLVKAVDRAGLLTWINHQPAGFATPVGERGCLLSGGQKQAVLLARCLYREPHALLLDEPTSSFDLSAEKQFVANIRDYLDAGEKRTLVIATHKLSLLTLVDRVILIEGGRLVADGPRDKVLERLRSGDRQGAAKDE